MLSATDLAPNYFGLADFLRQSALDSFNSQQPTDIIQSPNGHFEEKW